MYGSRSAPRGPPGQQVSLQAGRLPAAVGGSPCGSAVMRVLRALASSRGKGAHSDLSTGRATLWGSLTCSHLRGLAGNSSLTVRPGFLAQDVSFFCVWLLDETRKKKGTVSPSGSLLQMLPYLCAPGSHTPRESAVSSGFPRFPGAHCRRIRLHKPGIFVGAQGTGRKPQNEI